MSLSPKTWSWTAPPPDATWLDDCADAVPLVWLVRPDDSPPVPELISLLSSEERVRLERFRVPADQQRFLVGRALLRILLGLRLNVPPARVEFAYGPFGKPFVTSTAGKPAPHFNVSHSGNLVLLAFHPVHEVGVDVETVRPGHDWDAVARRMFAPADYDALAVLNPDERPTAFFKAWARHEARSKALGVGLSDDPATAQDASVMCYDIALPEGFRGATAIQFVHPIDGLV